MPQAASAHDTFWDFISLMPESMRMIMWSCPTARHHAQSADDGRLRRPGREFPEWELGIQVVEEKDEHRLDFDLLDPTKLNPEELVPVRRSGRLTLNRNPDQRLREAIAVTGAGRDVLAASYLAVKGAVELDGAGSSMVSTNGVVIGGDRDAAKRRPPSSGPSLRTSLGA